MEGLVSKCFWNNKNIFIFMKVTLYGQKDLRSCNLIIFLFIFEQGMFSEVKKSIYYKKNFFFIN